MFKKLVDNGMMQETQQTDGNRKLKELFDCLKDEAEGSDFDGESLEDETKIDFSEPW